jgi:hypothetical protein
MNEAAVQSRVRLECANAGLLIWRNNVGACEDKTGRIIRYGLCNDSAQLNREIKSSDLIGATPVTAYLQSAGWVKLAVLTALECKHSDWVFRPGDERAAAQMRFHEIVREAGGFAGFVTKPADIHDIIRRG